MKKIFFFLIFILLTVLLFNNYYRTISLKKYINNFLSYYKEKEDIDVFFLGTSRIYYSISPMEIWNNYGIVTYDRGNSRQYYRHTYNLIKEIFRNHKPKLIVCDIAVFIQEERKQFVNILLPNLKNNIYKLEYYNDYFQDDEIYENLNVFNLFHTRWKELNEYDFVTYDYWKGRYSGSYYSKYGYDRIHSVRSQLQNIDLKPDKLTFDNDTKYYIKKIVDLVHMHNSNITFINLPYVVDNYNYSYMLEFDNIVEKNNYIYIDYNKLYNEIGFDFKTDMKDWSHLNLYGSRKVMDHLIPYIIENYDIPVRKGDPKYKKWDEDYIKYARVINREEIRELPDFNRWKIQAFYDNYTVMISSNNNVMNKLPQDIKSFLKSKGLTKYETNKANMRYVAIIDDNKVFFEEISEKPVEYKGRMKRKVNLLVKSDGNSIINVSGKPRSKNKYGLNMVVYDKVNKEVVDSIWIDPNKPNEIRR